ncbi:prohead protease [Clostridium paraputrificum]|uniref:prohead protease n=1 Tax=Clostridium TaxID=1485 RepID=UPI000C07CA4B|nr:MULTISPECIES: prohead protease [Clostridium]MDB2089365.1 prohead protease [Clostridium paraputrificum]MDB2097724.1 prohead protease [Clostridium paraputrificum]MDU1180028.1 prohead protease [Clostridium sp.]MDU1228083.1 prohead protease [Clostridium sp.]MDU7654023.1 prohead protease [Clostridium sp.]
MNIKTILAKDLEDKRITDIVGEHIYFLHKDEDEKCDTYIEYEVINNKYSDFAGNKALTNVSLIQVDIFSKSNYIELEEVIKEVLKEKDYYYFDGADLYEKNTGFFHCAMRFRKQIFN